MNIGIVIFLCFFIVVLVATDFLWKGGIRKAILLSYLIAAPIEFRLFLVITGKGNDHINLLSIVVLSFWIFNIVLLPFRYAMKTYYTFTGVRWNSMITIRGGWNQESLTVLYAFLLLWSVVYFIIRVISHYHKKMPDVYITDNETPVYNIDEKA